jgi:hypothetical protein
VRIDRIVPNPNMKGRKLEDLNVPRTGHRTESGGRVEATALTRRCRGRTGVRTARRVEEHSS